MAAFTTLALLGLAGLAAGSTIKAKKATDALSAQTAPAPTALSGSAVPRGTALAGAGAPTPPDATLAASNAAVSALAAANKQRKKAGAGDALNLGTPGARTPPASFSARTLLGGY